MITIVISEVTAAFSIGLLSGLAFALVVWAVTSNISTGHPQ